MGAGSPMQQQATKVSQGVGKVDPLGGMLGGATARGVAGITDSSYNPLHMIKGGTHAGQYAGPVQPGLSWQGAVANPTAPGAGVVRPPGARGTLTPLGGR